MTRRLHILLILLLLLLLPLAAHTQGRYELPPTRLDRFTLVLPPAPEIGGTPAVAVNALNEIFVANKDEHQIVKYVSDGTPILQWGSHGTGPGQFQELYGLAVEHSTGEVYVAEDLRIQVFDSNGVYLREWPVPGTPGEFIPQGIDVDADAPDARAPGLAQNVPNPFNPRTEIRFNLPRDEDVTLTIYDVSGAVVCRLFSGRLPAGPHSVFWDGRDEGSRSAASGVYFCRLRSSSLDQTRKMVLSR